MKLSNETNFKPLRLLVNTKQLPNMSTSVNLQFAVQKNRWVQTAGPLFWIQLQHFADEIQRAVRNFQLSCEICRFLGSGGWDTRLPLGGGETLGWVGVYRFNGIHKSHLAKHQYYWSDLALMLLSGSRDWFLNENFENDLQTPKKRSSKIGLTTTAPISPRLHICTCCFIVHRSIGLSTSIGNFVRHISSEQLMCHNAQTEDVAAVIKTSTTGKVPPLTGHYLPKHQISLFAAMSARSQYPTFIP